MSFHPTTQRLILRAPMLSDQPDLLPLLNDIDVVKNLAPMPYPYTDGDYREFLQRYDAERRAGTAQHYAVTRAMDGALIGMCYLSRSEPGVWELGYWYGKPYWRQGYATEAARAVMRFVFEDLAALMITAGWLVDNPASGRVLEKLGFIAAGTMQRHCVGQGATVTSNRMLLTRDEFARKKAA